MNKYYEIDANGFFIIDVFAENKPDNCVTVQPPQNPSLYYAKWNGSAWIEGGTVPTPQAQPPSIDARLSAVESAISSLMGV
jgi:hypothetical protein